MRSVELVVMALLGLVVVLFVVRPLVRRIITPDVPVKPAALAAPMLGGVLPGAAGGRGGRHRGLRADQQPYVADDRHGPGAGPGARQSVQKVGELAERNPHETVAMIRQWLQDACQARPWPPPANKTNEIADLMATLAGRQQQNGVGRKLTGPERAAVLMLALGEQHGEKVWKLLDDDELRTLSIAMSTLGTVEAESVESLLLEFVGRMSASGALLGNYDATERLLQQYLPAERVSTIMEEIRGPAGRNMWEKLSNVQEQVLANYLKNEYPQTVAVVLSKIRPEHAARVLGILPEELALDVVSRMLKMEAVQKDVIERVENTLRTEFMSNLSQTRRRDAHEVMAEIFNNFDRQTETRFLTALEEQNRESAERIKTLMFTFDDLVKLDAGSAQTLMRHIDKDKLAIALKGASDPVRQFFLEQHVDPRRQDAGRRHAGAAGRCGCATSTRRRHCSSTWPRTSPPRARS